jgi:hypothetical protein
MIHRNIDLHSAHWPLIASRFLVFFSSAVMAAPGAMAVHLKT